MSDGHIAIGETLKGTKIRCLDSLQDGGCIPADFVESNTNNQTTEIYVADGHTNICPPGIYQ